MLRPGQVVRFHGCSSSSSSSFFGLWCLTLLIISRILPNVHSFSGAFNGRAFLSSPRHDDRPKLILIGGCSGTGKSTFGMTVALDQGILKCISTDTLRSVMRSFIDKDISPALHRSSYAEENEGDDPVRNWMESCTVLKHSVEDLVDEMIERRVSLVVEGVHLIPGTELIQKWEDNGGVALGIMLTVSDEEAHKALLMRRGLMTGRGEEEKLQQFHRIRLIHDEMVRLSKDANWMLLEQNLGPDPLDLVVDGLYNKPVKPAAEKAILNPIPNGLSMVEEEFANGSIPHEEQVRDYLS